ATRYYSLNDTAGSMIFTRNVYFLCPTANVEVARAWRERSPRTRRRWTSSRAGSRMDEFRCYGSESAPGVVVSPEASFRPGLPATLPIATTHRISLPKARDE